MPGRILDGANQLFRHVVSVPPTDFGLRLREAVRRDGDRVTRDVFDGPIPASWFERSSEALGDAAIKMVDRSEPAVYQLEDLIGFIPAIPDHEKLYQRIAEVCRQATTEPIPSGPRRRRGVDDPFSF